MVYVPDNPEDGEAYEIPLAKRCPKLRSALEALPHGLPAPDGTDSDSDSESHSPHDDLWTCQPVSGEERAVDAIQRVAEKHLSTSSPKGKKNHVPTTIGESRTNFVAMLKRKVEYDEYSTFDSPKKARKVGKLSETIGMKTSMPVDMRICVKLQMLFYSWSI